MSIPSLKQQIQELPLEIASGNTFGRYGKISQSQTFNMIVSDEWLVPYAGYKSLIEINSENVGRGLYTSIRGNFMIAVIGAIVYKIDNDLTPTAITNGVLGTTAGDVYIAENNSYQIALVDGLYVYVYDYSDGTFYSSQSGAPHTINYEFTDGRPGFISYHDDRFIIALQGTEKWVLSKLGDGREWLDTPSRVGLLQSKPGSVQAVVPVPGGGNNILVFGSNVAESWQDLGLALFPYKRNSTFNIDFGCINPASIASLENYVVWLAVNEQSGPVIMVAAGNQVQSISTDGIDLKLAALTDPANCTGFLFKQDGHLLYQFTFPTDNLSYVYDFKTKMFFTVTDEDLNYHIARQVVFFNNEYYFVSLNGGNVYQFGTQYTDAEYTDVNIKQLPRLRICPPVRLASQRNFIIKSLGFTVENGDYNRITTVSYTPDQDGDELSTEDLVMISTEDNNILDTESNYSAGVTYDVRSEAVDLSISRDGGATFGSSMRLEMNAVGRRKSRFIFQRLGIANDATFQIRFSGWGRFLATQGIVEVYE